MSKNIYLGDPKFAPLPNDQLSAWLQANDLDPAEIVAESIANVFDDFLTVVVFVRNDDGTKQLNEQGRAGYAKEFRTVPLLSTPENHNL